MSNFHVQGAKALFPLSEVHGYKYSHTLLMLCDCISIEQDGLLMMNDCISYSAH